MKKDDLTEELNTILTGIRNQIRIFDAVVEEETGRKDKSFLSETNDSFGLILKELRELSSIHINPRALALFFEEVEMIRLYAVHLLQEQEEKEAFSMSSVYKIQLDGLRAKNDAELGSGWRNRL